MEEGQPFTSSLNFWSLKEGRAESRSPLTTTVFTSFTFSLDVSFLKTYYGNSRYSTPRYFLDDRTSKNRVVKKKDRQIQTKTDVTHTRSEETNIQKAIDKCRQMGTRTDRHKGKQKVLPDRHTAIGWKKKDMFWKNDQEKSGREEMERQMWDILPL